MAALTEVELLRQQLADTTQQLAAAKRAVLVRNDFLAMVAHDLRQPLSVVLLTSSALLKMLSALDAGRPARKLVERIQASTHLLNHFVSDLLDISTVEGGHLAFNQQPNNIKILIEETCDALSVLCEEKGLSLKQSVGVASSAHVMCDKARFLQLMSNLIGNAIKFTDRGGLITVAVTEDDEGFDFSVTDTGVGIQQEDLPHVFDQFWMARRRSGERMTDGGFGLGLAIVRNLVEAQGGTVSAKSTPGEGSTFAFTLPKGVKPVE